MTTFTKDPFLNETIESEVLLKKLVDDGYLSSVVKPQTKDAKFQLLIEKEKWHLMFKDSFYMITLLDGFTLDASGGKKGWLKGSYTGKSKDIVVPASINGDENTEIY